MPAPPAEEGWTDLELKFGDTYELLDGQDRSWIGQEISPKCMLKKVEISDGKFAKHCPEGTLKWEVEGKKCSFVPLPRFSGSRHTLDLTLVSKDSFRPVFQLGGVEVELGMREGSVVAAGKGNSPLEPPTQRIRLDFSRCAGQTSFTMTTGEPLSYFLYQAVLASETRHMNVCEVNGRKFILTATLEEETGGATGSEPAGGAEGAAGKFTQGYLFWGLLAGLIFAAGILIGQAVCLCLRRRHRDEGSARTPQQGPPAADQDRQPDIESPYLNPRVLSHREPEPSDCTSSGSEHVYEEVDEDAFLSE
ncbi:uncharacterized protein [Penaeus vannamei]|uniref:uncharacterized protein n=1 Tax=Penaeus vannamei TaxID=6689 RepID=UPI00387F40BC